MDARNAPTAQLTVPAAAAQPEGADKPDAAEHACPCPGHDNPAEATDESKKDDAEGETTTQPAEGDDAAATKGDKAKGDKAKGDKAKPVEGEGKKSSKTAVKEVKVAEGYPGDDPVPEAQSVSLGEAEQTWSKGDEPVAW